MSATNADPSSSPDLTGDDRDAVAEAILDDPHAAAPALLQVLAARARLRLPRLTSRIAAHPSLQALANDHPESLLALHPDDAIALANESASHALLDVLASFRTGAVREAVADCVAAPETLARLADDPLPNVRERVVSNPFAPIETRARFASDPVPQIRALSPATDAAALATLARDEDWLVREAVARNEHTLGDLLGLLATDPNGSVRDSVACNANTPLGVLEVLARDEHHYVRAGVAVHGAATDALLRRLGESDPDDDVRERARDTLQRRAADDR